MYSKRYLQMLAATLMQQRHEFCTDMVGQYSIRRQWYEAGASLPVVSMRDALFAGLPQTDLEAKGPTCIHVLDGPEGTWMTDLPCELVQMYLQLAKYASGRVLIGGLLPTRACCTRYGVLPFGTSLSDVAAVCWNMLIRSKSLVCDIGKTYGATRDVRYTARHRAGCGEFGARLPGGSTKITEKNSCIYGSGSVH